MTRAVMFFLPEQKHTAIHKGQLNCTPGKYDYILPVCQSPKMFWNDTLKAKK